MQKVVIGIIWNQEQKICIAKRSNHVHLAGLWEFPGGRVDYAENPIKALQRELEEEDPSLLMKQTLLETIKQQIQPKKKLFSMRIVTILVILLFNININEYY